MSATLQTVHVRINDNATGQPTPCRVRFTGPDGTYYAPFGRLTEFATGRNQDVGGNLKLGMKPYAYIDGTCEIGLPVGNVHIDVSKGPEFTPLQLEVPIGPGKLAIRLTIERWIDKRKGGWHSGDTRCHFLAPHAALLEAQAEDLAVVDLLACSCQIPSSHGQMASSITNIHAFSGQAPSLEVPGHKVVVNTHNTHPVLGNLGLLNCHRAVYPLSFGGSGELDYWTMADWCDQCHRKRGLVIWTKTNHESAGFRYGEPLADLILGKVDAFEIDAFEDSPFDVLSDWYDLLNCGFAVPLVGASGKENNGIALGSMRTYARLRPGEALTYKTWIEAIRAGRTFATNGPLLSFHVEGNDIGSSIRIPHAGDRIRFKAEAQSLVPFDVLEIVANGQVVAKADSQGSGSSTCLQGDLSIEANTWLAARCRGQQQLLHRPANQRVFVHTSPVYVQIEGQAPAAPANLVASFGKQLDEMISWARTQARCETEKQRERLVDIFGAAKEELERRAPRH